MNEFNFIKNPTQEARKPINPEQLHIHNQEVKKDPVFTPEELDNELERMELSIARIEAMESEMSPEEKQYVEEALMQSDEGRNILKTLQEKTDHALQAGHHLSSELSEQYNPRMVKTVQKLGKIVGGLGGMMAGHGVASAAGAVAGAKLGEYGALKTFEAVARRVPDSWKERIKKPDDQLKIAQNQEIHDQKLEQINQIDSDIEQITTEIESLPVEKREILNQLIEQDDKGLSTVDRMKNIYVRYEEFCEHFETKYPLLGTATDFALHASLGPLLHGLDLGTSAIHAVEMLAASGGTEKLTSHCLQAFESMKRAGQNIRQKMNDLLNNQPVESLPLAA